MRPVAPIAAWTAGLALAVLPGAVGARPAQAPGKVDVENHRIVGGSFDSPGMAEARFATIAFDYSLSGKGLGGAPYWYEYGPTTAYGSRTATRIAPPVRGGHVELRAVGAPVEYEREYHYRVVMQGPDGPLVGRDGMFTARHTPLRPISRVLFNWTPSGSRSLRVKVTVLDARGQIAFVSRCKGGGNRCDRVAAQRALPRSAVVARDVDVPFGDRLVVGTSREVLISQDRTGRRAALTTTFRAGDPPSIRETCIGDVILPGELSDGGQNRCISVRALNSGGRITHASVADAVRGTRVEVLCSGPGCARRREVHTVTGGTFARPYETIRLPRLTRARPGATIKVYVTRPGSLGLYRRLKLTTGDLERGPYRCIAAGSARRLTSCR